MIEPVAANVAHRMVGLAESDRFGPEQLTTLGAWIAAAPDEELFRVNLVSWAADHRVPERDSVDLFVHAARAGLFDFSWGVVCPSCSSYITTRAGLRGLTHRRICQICQKACSALLDDGVEVTFTVNPAVRRIRFHGEWRVDGPLTGLEEDLMRIHFSANRNARRLMKPTAIKALVLDRDQPRILEGEVTGAGAWMVLCPSVHAVVRLEVVPGGPDRVEAEIQDGFAVPSRLQVGPGRVAVALRNRTDEPGLLVALLHGGTEEITRARFQTMDPAAPFLSGKRLLSNQAFRELFRTESIAPDSSLDIRNLAFLFTDLKASTQLYERVGDLAALDMVRKHFHVLTDVVARRGRAVVKTIGDAVMATFAEPRDAVEAGIEMHRAVQRELAHPQELVLKVGVHAGPCITIDSNERLDYFGQTVNIAARVQALAEGRELVCTERVLSEPAVVAWLAQAGLSWHREEASLKGVSAPVLVRRTQIT